MCSLFKAVVWTLGISHTAAWIALLPGRQTAASRVGKLSSSRPSRLLPLGLGLFGNIPNPFEKASSIFEESTTLGKGVTFAKIQVALEAPNRSSGSILGLLAAKADAADTDSARGLAKLVSEVKLISNHKHVYKHLRAMVQVEARL